MTGDFDLPTYHRDKIRRLEQRVVALEDHRNQLERLLGLTLLIAVRDTEIHPLTLLAVIEDTDRIAA